MWAELSMRTMLVKLAAHADEQVEDGEPDDGAAEALELRPGDGELLVAEQDDEDAGDAEDRA